jgi:hypothetical protein
MCLESFKTSQKMKFAEEHMYRMNSGKVQVNKMVDQGHIINYIDSVCFIDILKVRFSNDLSDVIDLIFHEVVLI